MLNKDQYSSFQELSRREIEGVDYKIVHRVRDPTTLILAIHGGGIEPYTDTVANLIAGTEFSFYAFAGTNGAKSISRLHLRSSSFDEPRALEMVAQAENVIAVHGQRDRDREFVLPGGLATSLRDDIWRSLASEGFTITEPPPRLSGTHPLNICNRGVTSSGVQLELSFRLRKKLVMDQERLRAFGTAVRSCLGR